MITPRCIGQCGEALLSASLSNVSLLADLGGTNSRFAVAGSNGRVQHIEILHADDYPTPLAAARAYIEGLPRALKPDNGLLAVAAPIVGGRVTFVNRGWSFGIESLRKALHLKHITVLNDLEAQAYALNVPDRKFMHKIGGKTQEGRADSKAPRLAIGPGTGLGMAALLPDAKHPRVIAGEGGHATLAPANVQDFRVLAALHKRYGHASVERALSGPGLPALYSALSGKRTSLQPAEIAAHAKAKSDSRAVKTAHLFSHLLGSFCGDMALAFGALGGVYIVGGVVPGLGRAFEARAFREAFEDKGRYRAYLCRVPVFVVDRKDLGLQGLVAYRRSRHA
jgi:glucokinase